MTKDNKNQRNRSLTDILRDAGIVESEHIMEFQLIHYFDGTLPASEKKRLETHLVACVQCDEEVQEIKSLGLDFGNAKSQKEYLKTFIETAQKSTREENIGNRSVTNIVSYINKTIETWSEYTTYIYKPATLAASSKPEITTDSLGNRFQIYDDQGRIVYKISLNITIGTDERWIVNAYCEDSNGTRVSLKSSEFQQVGRGDLKADFSIELSEFENIPENPKIFLEFKTT